MKSGTGERRVCRICTSEVVRDWAVRYCERTGVWLCGGGSCSVAWAAGERSIPEQAPSGVESRVEAIAATLGAINSDDWAIARVAALRAKGERATFRIDWRRQTDGRKLYLVTVRRSDGTIERSPWPLGVYDPPTCQGPTTYTEQDRFVGVGKAKGGGEGSQGNQGNQGDPDPDPTNDASSKACAICGENCGNPYHVGWVGCGECDPLFPCHEGRARCLRLEPMDPWSSLNDAIDLVVDLGGAIDEGIAGRIFGRMHIAMQQLSLRSRKWLSAQATASKAREGAKRATYDGSGSHVVSLDPEPEVHPWDRPPTADSKDWRIGKNAMQAPRGDVLFLADLGKLLGTIGVSLVTEMQDGADRAQLLNSSREEELFEELWQRSRASTSLRGAIDSEAVAAKVLEGKPPREPGAGTEEPST